jgi:hypothetical protein
MQQAILIPDKVDDLSADHIMRTLIPGLIACCILLSGVKQHYTQTAGPVPDVLAIVSIRNCRFKTSASCVVVMATDPSDAARVPDSLLVLILSKAVHAGRTRNGRCYGFSEPSRNNVPLLSVT